MNELPKLLNFDKDQLLLTPEGMNVVDEAIQWNSADNESFDTRYPAVLAYYGQFHIHNEQGGKWVTIFDSANNVWIPQVVLPNGLPAFDSNEFYKRMFEGPTPMEWF